MSSFGSPSSPNCSNKFAVSCASTSGVTLTRHKCGHHARHIGQGAIGGVGLPREQLAAELHRDQVGEEDGDSRGKRAEPVHPLGDVADGNKRE